MRIKSYFANSVQAAMRQAHEDLGADAVLIESHATSEEAAHLGQFEVVCGLAEAPARKPARTKRAAASASTGQDELAAELKMLRSQMDELRSMLKPAPAVTSQMEAVRDELIAADVEPSIVAMLLESALPRRGADSARQMIADALRARLRTAANPITPHASAPEAGLQPEGGAGLQPANGASAPRAGSGNSGASAIQPGARAGQAAASPTRQGGVASHDVHQPASVPGLQAAGGAGLQPANGALAPRSGSGNSGGSALQPAVGGGDASAGPVRQGGVAAEISAAAPASFLGLQAQGGAGLQPANGPSGPRSRPGNAIVFVGPPGAGKTTTLAKIAVKHCLAERRTVRIVSFDGERIGAHERLRTFASVLGIGFVAANSIAELLDALTESRSKECVLIDTPGYSAADIEAARDLATVLERAAPRDVHLVLPACAKRSDLAAFSERFALFQPTKLLFTKLDETASFGSIVSEALRLDKPMSFFTTGQEVPEDLEDASAETLIRKVLPPETAAAASAA